MNSVIYAVQIDDKDKIGLHARPVSKITAAIGAFKDTTVKAIKLNENADITKEITITNKVLSGTTTDGKKVSGKDFSNEKEGNAKSVLSLLGLQISNFSKVVFIIDGPEAKQAQEKLKEVLLAENLIK